MTETSDNDRVLSARQAVDAYREAHRQLHAGGWYKGISEDHTPLLEKLVSDLDKLGFTSTEAGFEPKKTEILAGFWADSDLQNIEELGFTGKEDFEARATEADREALEEKWH